MTIRFSRTNGPLDEVIDSLLRTAGTVHHPELVREMIISALKAGIEEEGKADLKLMNSTLKEMRFTSKVFGPYADVRKVTVFGSARTHPEEPVYRMAYDFGKALAAAGFMVITGAGGGIMQAANEGAGPKYSFGVNIQLPFEQKPNPVVHGNPRLINYKYFFNRKVAFLKEAHAIALFPGGFGTLDEAMETLTLAQNGKHSPLPLILIDEPGGTYWLRWLKFFRDELLTGGYITESDFLLFERVDSIAVAVAKIRHFYHRYHSIRYIDGTLVMRLSSTLPGHAIEQLATEFTDLLVQGGTITLTGPLPVEADEPELAHLPRLVIDFNRKNFGRLRQLIDSVNSF